jgi:hypothetical protein
MTRLRLWCAALLAWFFLLFNVERLYAPLDLASFVYALAALLSLGIIFFPFAGRLSWPSTALALLVALLSAKWCFGYRIGQSALPLTVTEYCALGVSVAFARQLASGLEEFRTALFRCLVTDLEDRTHSFDAGQAHLYREVRRARWFARPLSVLAIAPEPGAVEAARDRLQNEMTNRMLHQYVTARLADLLSRGLKDCDVIAQRQRHFVAVLPETKANQAEEIAGRLQDEARNCLGLDLRIGISSFPAEEVTLVRLLERAESRMHSVSQAEEEGYETVLSPAESRVEERSVLEDTVVLSMDSTKTDIDTRAGAPALPR